MTDKATNEPLSPPQQQQRRFINDMNAVMPVFARLQARQERVLAYTQRLVSEMESLGSDIDNRRDMLSIQEAFEKYAALEKRAARAKDTQEKLWEQSNRLLHATLDAMQSGAKAYQQAQIEHEVCYGGVQDDITAKPMPAVKRRNLAPGK